MPDSPITVVIDHYDPPVGACVAGGILTALGAAGATGSILLIADQRHCTPGTSAATVSAFDSCIHTNDTHDLLGAFGLALSVTVLIIGPVILGTAAGHGTHPLTLMSPGELLHRPIARRGPDVRLAGFGLAPIPGGAMAGASLSF